MKIFTDTNVLISAFTSFGTCFDVLEDARKIHALYHSAFVLEEVKKVLQNKFLFPENMIRRFLCDVEIFSTLGKSGDASTVTFGPDPSDRQILADAVANHLDAILTGDKALLELKVYKHIQILSPKNYWRL